MFLIPPKRAVTTDGSFTFPTPARIATIHSDDRIPVLQLVGDLSRLECGPRATQATRDAEILFTRKRSVRHPQGYVLTISPQRIEIASSTATGAYYATQTLRELIAANGRTLPCMTITDEPDLTRRGYYLDCSRGKVPTVATVTELVERLARWKINELELYVENVFTFSRHPEIGVGFSPFSPEDILTIQEHCAEHHVDFVPSLTSLGHFEKILMLPGYEELGELPGFHDVPGGTTLNPVDPRSIELVADMYAEFLPLFTADDFNACGDEPWELGQGRSKAKADEVGLGTVYLDFILELRRLSVQHGKRMNLWGDIVLKHPEIIPELPPELVLLNWEYTPNGERIVRNGEFVEAGLPLVCCPGTHGWQSHGTRLRTSMNNIHGFAGVAVESGAEGLLNTDWGDWGHRNTLGVSMHAAAYGGACSWNHAGAPLPDGDEFLAAYALHSYADSSGVLVPVVKTIGDDEYGSWAYHALIESLVAPEGFGDGFSKARPVIDSVGIDEPTLRSKIEAADALAANGAWEAAGMAIDNERRAYERRAFERTTIEEYALSNLMNRAAARRVLLARELRGGDRVAPQELTAHRDELDEIRERFSALWLRRSRPSRLVDSLAGLERAMRETEELGA